MAEVQGKTCMCLTCVPAPAPPSIHTRFWKKFGYTFECSSSSLIQLNFLKGPLLSVSLGRILKLFLNLQSETLALKSC